MSQGSVDINIKECMTYLTANADLNEISDNKFVKEHWDLIQKITLANEIEILLEKWMMVSRFLYLFYQLNKTLISNLKLCQSQDQLTNQLGQVLITILLWMESGKLFPSTLTTSNAVRTMFRWQH